MGRGINQLDPLNPRERSAAFEARHSTYFRGADEQAEAALGRLAGGDWEKAWKISADYASQPEPSSTHWLFGYCEKSVFEISGEED